MYAFVEMNPLRAPTKIQLFNLTAVPAGFMNRTGRSKRKSKLKLAQEGRIISKLFNSAASRPQPTNGLSLEQSIMLEMTLSGGNLFTTSATIGITAFAGLTFSVSQFSGAAGLLSVFDQYRFEQLEVWIESPTPNSTPSTPELFTAVDLDDGNVPSAVGQIQDHLGSIVSGGFAGHYHKWRPHVAIAAYSGAFTSYSNQVAGWLDSASPNVQHFGLKAAAVSTGSVYSFTYVVRAVISLRSPSIN